MSFLAARDKLPTTSVVSAGTYCRLRSKSGFIFVLAQCLYILTDDNGPAITDVKLDAGYISCLVSIIQPGPDAPQPEDSSDHRLIMLRVLAAGTILD